jgi:hypothetical protein
MVMNKLTSATALVQATPSLWSIDTRLMMFGEEMTGNRGRQPFFLPGHGIGGI